MQYLSGPFSISTLKAEISEFSSAVCLELFLCTVLPETVSFDSANQERCVRIQNAFLKQSLKLIKSLVLEDHSVYSIL